MSNKDKSTFNYEVFKMWSINTNQGRFEGDTLIEAVNNIAEWTVDDWNGEHSPTPYIENISYFTDDEHEVTDGFEAVQDKLEETAIAMQEGYFDAIVYKSETSRLTNGQNRY